MNYDIICVMSKSYTAIIEQDEETGLYVAYVPGLRGAHTQAETLEELKDNLQDVVELVTSSEDHYREESHFVGTQLVTV